VKVQEAVKLRLGEPRWIERREISQELVPVVNRRKGRPPVGEVNQCSADRSLDFFRGVARCVHLGAACVARDQIRERRAQIPHGRVSLSAQVVQKEEVLQSPFGFGVT
jgi:hypothetical protein